MTTTAPQGSVASELGGLKAELEVAWAGLSARVASLGDEELGRHLKRVHVASDRYLRSIAAVMQAYVQHRDADRLATPTHDEQKQSNDEVSPDAT